MVGQSHIFIAAPVRTGATEELTALLETMNSAPGTADPANALVPFGLIPTIHVARFVILDDHSLPDRQQIAPQLPATEPLRLAFAADCDGTVDDLLRTLVRVATPGLQQIFGHCSDFDAHSDLLAWLHAHRIVSSAAYANWPGRTVTQVREEAALHAALRQARLAHPEASPGQLRDILLTAARDVPLTPLPVPTFAEKLAEIGDFLLLPLYVLLLSPLLIPALPFLIILLRWRETHDPVLIPIPSLARNKLLSSIEDRDVSNQYSTIGSLKPGLFRRWLSIAVLYIINWGGRHLFSTGRLGRVNTIHFASWTFLDDKRRVFFDSNYDGSREAYNDDFINKVAYGLNVSFSNGLGYPQTNWLIFGGARHEQDFKRYLFHHQIPTQVCPQRPHPPRAHRKPDRLRATGLDRGDMRMAANDEAADIQALVDRGFGSLTGACYLLLRIDNPALAKPWLRTLDIASLAQARTERLPQVCQIAFTAAGLRVLGTEVTPRAGFDLQFIDGIAGDECRSHQLGDEGANAPAHWRWGVGEQEPHILLLLFAANTAIDSLEQATCSAAQAAGCAVISSNTPTTTTPLGHEPFGFADGVSQPDYDWGGTLTPGGTRDRDYRNLLAMGELLLGYPNEYGFISDYPHADELGRNGSYLVYRQLAQDVAGFWQWLAGQAGDGAIALAERMVGRGLDGAPLPGLGSATIMGIDDPRNAFLFAEDPDGRVCPIGAHIRRLNPRSSDDPQGRHGFLRDLISTVGFSGTAMHDAVASSRFHRLYRRGRPYGPVIAPQDAMQGTGADQEIGLHFLCLNTNIARQFEFVQGAWGASAKFAGLAAEQDPLLGNRLPLAGAQPTNDFSYTDTGACPRTISGLPQFVTVRGGAYLFLPGLHGLAQILADS